LDLTPILKRSPNPERRCRSRPDTPVGRPSGRPTHPLSRPIGRPSPTETPACQSIDRSIDRSVDRSPARVDRTVDRAALCTFVHAGLAAGLQSMRHRFLLTSNLCTISPNEFKKLYHSFLSSLSLQGFGPSQNT